MGDGLFPLPVKARNFSQPEFGGGIHGVNSEFLLKFLRCVFGAGGRFWLRKRSAAVLSWIVELNPADIVDFQGDVPLKTMLEILERLKEEE